MNKLNIALTGLIVVLIGVFATPNVAIAQNAGLIPENCLSTEHSGLTDSWCVHMRNDAGGFFGDPASRDGIISFCNQYLYDPEEFLAFFNQVGGFLGAIANYVYFVIQPETLGECANVLYRQA